MDDPDRPTPSERPEPPARADPGRDAGTGGDPGDADDAGTGDAPDNDRSGTIILAGSCLFGAGWFALSHFAMGTPTGDAIGEALGAALGVLVFISIIGAVRMRNR